MLEPPLMRTGVALNRPASKLTVQAVQREVLQRDQSCNGGRLVDRDRPQLSCRPQPGASGQRCDANSPGAARLGPLGVTTHEPGA